MNNVKIKSNISLEERISALETKIAQLGGRGKPRIRN